MDDLDDLLCRVERLAQLEPDGALANARLHAADDLEVDVGLEQGEPDLAQDLVDVFLAQVAATAQPLENPIESVGQRFEHAEVEATRRSMAPSPPDRSPVRAQS